MERIKVFRRIFRSIVTMADEPLLQYACQELRALPVEFVEFYLPQLTHLIVHYPSGCAPLEEFLVEVSAASVPICIQLIWLLEANAGDLDPTERSSKEILRRCLHLLNIVKQSYMSKAERATMQGDVHSDADEHASWHSCSSLCESVDLSNARQSSSLQSTRKERLHSSQQKRHLLIQRGKSVSTLSKMDPFSSSPQSSYTSSLSSSRHATDSSFCGYDHDSRRPTTTSDIVGQKYNARLVSQSTDLRVLHNKLKISEALRSQLFFIERLLQIGERLTEMWPPSRRESALQSKVKTLNHNLPEDLFIPLCYSSDYYHSILGIFPGEARVFSSRTRAPYMLIFEVKKSFDCTIADMASHKWTLSTGDISDRAGERAKKSKMDFFSDKDSTTEILSNMLKTHAKANRWPNPRNLFRRSSTEDLYNIKNTPYGELWCMKKERLRATSAFGREPGWDLVPMIVKVGDDLRQEQLAAQIIGLINQIFRDANLSLWLRPYRFIVTAADSGLVEVLTDCVSIHQLKKGIGTSVTLSQYFQEAYRSATSEKLRVAKRNFVESLAGYSIVCYLLQVKDRHNGNILIHLSGHIIHIDYGFILGMSPGGVNFEGAPFKFTKEYLDVMDGQGSEYFSYFRMLFVEGLLEVRKYMEDIVLLVQMLEQGSTLPCLADGDDVVSRLVERFQPDLPDDAFIEYAQKLIYDSVHCWSTTHYDSFQYLTNGIH